MGMLRWLAPGGEVGGDPAGFRGRSQSNTKAKYRYANSFITRDGGRVATGRQSSYR